MPFGLLSLLMFLPLTGALLLFVFVRGDDERAQKQARLIALLVSLLTFILSLELWINFDTGTADFQFVEKVAWFHDFNISYHLGIDGISLFMVLLTTLLLPICILSTRKGVHLRVREFMICFLVLESFVIGVFVSLDAMLFYLFFEGMLIPMYLIIGIWGGANRIYASYKFFLYTLLGSVLFLIALLYLYFSFGTMDIPTLMERVPTLSIGVQRWLWLAMFASFAVKVPMWPVHTWLPDAHVQAPTAGSVILAGILLKMGAYGFLRFSMPMLPQASLYFTPLMFVLSVIAVIYTSLVALRQEDMKKLIAYSSVAHMGFVTIGLFAMKLQSVEGSIVQMISHGLVSGALFLCVGVVYDRLHTREIARYGGLVKIMPLFAFVFLFMTMGSAGLPGTSGFVGEFLVLIGTFATSHVFAFLTATGMILGAAYSLLLYRRVMYGPLEKEDLKFLPDLDLWEKCSLAPLVILVLWLGVYPKPVFHALDASVENLLTHMARHSIGEGHEMAEMVP